MRILIPALAAALLAACHPHADGLATAHDASPVVLDGRALSSVARPGTAAGTRLTGIQAGTAVQAFLSPDTVALIDPADRPYLERALIRAHNTPDGLHVSWLNPDTGSRGTVRPTRTGTAIDGHPCREMESEIRTASAHFVTVTSACRAADGTWSRGAAAW